MYPASEGARFYFDLHMQRHIPMVKDRMASFGLGTVTVDRGVASFAPGVPAPFLCIASLEFPSAESVQQGLAAHGSEIMGDIPDHTDVQPVMQIGKVEL